MPEDHSEEIRLLTDAAVELVDKVNTLNEESGRQIVHLSHRARTNRKLIYVLALLIAALVVGFIRIDRLSNKVDQNTRNLQYNSTVQRQKALCPLYQLFIDSKSPQGRAAAPDPVKYDNAFKVIQSGYDVLGCKEFNSK